MKYYLPVLIGLSLNLLSSGICAQDMNLQLNPKQNKVITNTTFWTIHATCQIHSNADSTTLRVNDVKNSSEINGKTLLAGQSTSMVVHDQKTIRVTAEPGAEVMITNLSQDQVDADCSAS